MGTAGDRSKSTSTCSWKHCCPGNAFSNFNHLLRGYDSTLSLSPCFAVYVPLNLGVMEKNPEWRHRMANGCFLVQKVFEDQPDNSLNSVVT